MQEASFYTCMETAQQESFSEYVREGWQANYANILVRPSPQLCILHRQARDWDWHLAHRACCSSPH